MIFATLPYQFDAWVAERFAPPGKQGFSIGIVNPFEHPASHITRALLPLRLEPDPSARVLAHLVSGVSLLIGATQGALHRVRFNEAHGHDEGNDFWVTSADLAADATPVH